MGDGHWAHTMEIYYYLAFFIFSTERVISSFDDNDGIADIFLNRRGSI
jgi:hypothetical protein